MQDSPAPADQESAEPQFLLGRLFVVPLVIVLVIVFCAVVVVFSFGAIVSTKGRPVLEVLATLEAGTGRKAAGVMLMPREKEMWQAAQEIALRLENLEQEVPPEELPEVQRRLAELLKRDLASIATASRVDKQRTYFIMRAAAKSRALEAIPLLIEALQDPDSEVRRETLAALALMGDVAPARAQAGHISTRLEDPDPVVQMLACVALTNLADADDQQVVEALWRAQARSSDDPEVRWNTTLTLARLGSAKALPSIMDMLRRDYWEKQSVRYRSGEGEELTRPMTPKRIEDYLMATLDAASSLEDRQLWDHITELCDDPSLRVAGKAKQLVERRSSAAAPRISDGVPVAAGSS